MQRPVHQEAEALAGAAQQKTEKFREFRCYRGQDLTIGASRSGKPSFLAHCEMIMDQVRLAQWWRKNLCEPSKVQQQNGDREPIAGIRVPSSRHNTPHPPLPAQATRAGPTRDSSAASEGLGSLPASVSPPVFFPHSLPLTHCTVNLK